MARHLSIVRIVIVALALLAAAGSVQAEYRLLFWAPGYPGDTVQAQETMNRLASELNRRLSGPSLTAQYHESHDGGLAAIEEGSTAVTVVSAPVYHLHADRFGLEPIAQAVQLQGRDESWALVGPKGAKGVPAGARLRSSAGYAPGFVRHVLAGFPGLPEGTPIEFTERPRSDLRKVARGEPLVVLTDGAQSAALDALSFAGDLEVLYRSPPMITNVVCVVSGRLSAEEAGRLRRALLSLSDDEAGRELLAELRLSAFRPVSDGELRAIRP